MANECIRLPLHTNEAKVQYSAPLPQYLLISGRASKVPYLLILAFAHFAPHLFAIYGNLRAHIKAQHIPANRESELFVQHFLYHFRALKK